MRELAIFSALAVASLEEGADLRVTGRRVVKRALLVRAVWVEATHRLALHT